MEKVLAYFDIVTVYADCPHCGEPLVNPENGSMMIPAPNFGESEDHKYSCLGCDKKTAIDWLNGRR